MSSNQFPPTANLAKLPAFLREAMDTVVPIREGEVPAEILLRRQVSLNYPNGRLQALVQEPEKGETQKKERVSLRLLDHKGIEMLVQVALTPENLRVLLPTLIKIHKSFGGSLEDLL